MNSMMGGDVPYIDFTTETAIASSHFSFDLQLHFSFETFEN